MVMFKVVPIKETTTPSASIDLITEALRISREILEGFELSLRVRIIVGNVRSGVGFGHAQVRQEHGKGF